MRRALPFLFCVVAACGGPPQTKTVKFTPADAAVSDFRRQMQTINQQILPLLSQSDIRLAQRMGHGPGGDPFTFQARTQELESARNELRHFREPQKEFAGDPRLADAMLDKTIVEQLIEGEFVRLRREATSGGGAVTAEGAIDVLEGVVLFIDEAQSRELEDDKLLSWRLRDIRSELKPNTISQYQRDELKALIAAKLANRGPTTDREVALMQKHLEKLPVAPYPLMTEGQLDKELDAFVALPGSLDTVLPFLEKADQALRFPIDTAFGVLSPAAQEDVRKRAIAVLAKPPPCLPSANVENARQMGPPDERARSCALVRALSIAQNDLDELAALLAIREAVVTAARSALMHGRVRDPQIAARKWPRLLPLSPDAEQRELLLAANHPTKAIAAGCAAGILTLAGGAKTRERAREWMRFGDADFEAVDRHLVLTTSSTSVSPKPPPR